MTLVFPLLLLLVARSATAAPVDDKQCSTVMSHMAMLILKQDQVQMMKEMAPYMMFSMKGMAQYGDYDACEKTHQYADVSMTTVVGGKTTTSIIGGMCLTEKCSIEHLNQNMGQIQGFAEFIAKQFKIEIPPAKFAFVDVSIKPPKTSLFHLTILLLIALKLLTFGMMALRLYRRHSSKSQPMRLEEVNQVDIEDRKDLQINTQATEESINQSSTQVPAQKVDSTYFFLEDFDVSKNWRFLVDSKVPDPNLIIFNGIRSIAFLEVIFGHVFIYCAITGNMQEAQTQYKQPLMMFIMNCMYSVDIFLWISGFFLSYVALDPRKRDTFKKQGISWLGLGILNRVLRIWPMYAITILIFGWVQPIIPSGPRAYVASSDCKYWYQHLLFYQNMSFAKADNCIPQDWYLACDMQMFLVGICICYAYIHTNPKVGKGLILLALTIFQGYGTYYCFKHQNPVMYLNEFNVDFQYDYYLKPWTRAPPYFLGMLFGLLYREKKNELQEMGKKYPKLLSVVCYVISLTIIGYFFFGWYQALHQGIAFRPLNQQIFEQAFCRLIVSFGVGLMVLVNMAGIHDVVNTWFMGNLVFKFLAKISYVGYLIHWTIMVLVFSTVYESPNPSLMVFLPYFVGITLITLLFSISFFLLVEAPFGNLVGRLKSKEPVRKERPQIMVKNKVVEGSL